VVHLLVVLVPLGLAAAVSPVMLTEQTVLLAGPGGRRDSLLYATGTAAVLAIVVGGILLVGQTLSLPKAPHLSAALDLGLGCVLLALALVLLLRRPREHDSHRRSKERVGPAAALAFGVFSMVTNVTTLAFVIPGAKEIAGSHVHAWEGLIAAVLLVALACLPAWGPVAFASAAPDTATDVLDRLEQLIRRHGRLLAVLLIGAAGAFLVIHGIIRLVGL
jgi:threonine/homoserine/homoserine lactone efflux protein